MKSPDRDAADELTHYSLDAHTETLRTPKGWVHVRHVENGSVGSQREAVEWLASELATLLRRVDQQHSALERLRYDAMLILARKPVRNFDETLAEVDAALAGAKPT